MSAQDGPPQGMETKDVPGNTPGYVVAQTVNADHPGHMTDKFAGVAGYTNTPGITDPEDKSDDAEDGGDGKSTARKSTTTKASGTTAK